MHPIRRVATRPPRCNRSTALQPVRLGATRPPRCNPSTALHWPTGCHAVVRRVATQCTTLQQCAEVTQHRVLFRLIRVTIHVLGRAIMGVTRTTRVGCFLAYLALSAAPPGRAAACQCAQCCSVVQVRSGQRRRGRARLRRMTAPSASGRGRRTTPNSQPTQVLPCVHGTATCAWYCHVCVVSASCALHCRVCRLHRQVCRLSRALPPSPRQAPALERRRNRAGRVTSTA